MNIKNITLFLLLLIAAPLYSQIELRGNHDIKKLMEEGKASAAIYPDSLTPKLERAFDGEAFTDIGGSGIDSIQITITFTENIPVMENKVHFMVVAGTYTVEMASSEADFNGKTGTYVKVANNKTYPTFKWDSVSVSMEGGVKIARLTFKNAAKMIYLGEWAFEKMTTVKGLVVVPYTPVKLIPNSSIKLSAEMLDENNQLTPYNLGDELIWTSQTPSVIQFEDESSTLKAVSLGTGTVTVSNTSNTLIGTASVVVTDDFKPEKAAPHIVKVAVVYQDPLIGGMRYHVKHGWTDPKSLVNDIIKDFLEVSDSVVQFQIVEVHEDSALFTYRTDTTGGNVKHKMTWEEIDATPYPIPSWFRSTFDYKEMEQYYGFGEKRDQGLIDEVWVYTTPYGGMWESQLMGPTAFWWNSTPIQDVSFKKLLSVMGLNYERGVAEGIHSFGHRMESAIRVAYGRWDTKASDPNDWELFTRIDRDVPGQGYVGNVHYPVNAAVDNDPDPTVDPGNYDYDNTRKTASRADNWLRFPYLFDFVDTVSRSTWGGWDYQRNYLKWWYKRMPRYKGIKNGVLNDWWAYFLDFDKAKQEAEGYVYIGINDMDKSEIPSGFQLNQNYPNPFNPYTTIEYFIKDYGDVKVSIYNLLGQEIETLINTAANPGQYKIRWAPKNAASGMYICRVEFMNAADRTKISKSMKMIYLK
jgi:hypothetical protein